MRIIRKSIFLFALLLTFSFAAKSAHIFIPMDNAQSNHLKAYGIAFYVLTYDVEVSWLLNYRGGSFMFPHHSRFERELAIRGVSFQVIADLQAASIINEVTHPDVNMEEIVLHKVPKIAVYTPPHSLPWDDAVTLALTYAEIPYDAIYDEEVLAGVLPLYDWLHVHHEDFTGQFGKFWAAYRNAPWYQRDVQLAGEMARKQGFNRVADLKLAVARSIQQFVAGGGYMFAMCSAPESLDIALAAEGVDIVHEVFDGTPMDPNAQDRLDFNRTFAFQNFQIVTNPFEYAKSDIDVPKTGRDQRTDFFSLFEFSAKWDPVPTMLTQNHETLIKGFMGQTTAFKKHLVKPTVTIMGETRGKNEARYIHGTLGKGTFTFYGGHDPEDYRHFVGDPPTDLNLFPNSPGYRLILNNVLFPAARKQKQKT
ncbi:MAG: asparagine synthetase B [Bacteroidetes bacterium]|nr:MAG: asparagine synthetase B [Bacteroidota bacterium]